MCQRAGALRTASSSCQCDSWVPVAWSPTATRPIGSLIPSRPSLRTMSSMLSPASDTSRPVDVSRPCRLNTSASFHVGFDVAFFADVRFFFSFLPPHVISTLTNGSDNRRQHSYAFGQSAYIGLAAAPPLYAAYAYKVNI